MKSVYKYIALASIFLCSYNIASVDIGIATQKDSILRHSDQAASRMGRIGNAYEKLDSHFLAKYYLSEAVRLSESQNNEKDLSFWLGKLGKVSISIQQFDSAEIFLQNAIKLSKKIKSKANLKDQFESLTNLYATQKNTRKALESYKLACLYSDSIFSEENLEKHTRQEMEYEFKKTKLIEQEQENEKNRIEEIRIHRKYTLQYSGIGLGLIICFISVFVFSKTYSKRKGDMDSVRFQKVIHIILFVFFLIFFEFILVLLDPLAEKITGNQPALRLGVNAILAGIIFPLHGLLEKMMTAGLHMNQWNSKNIKEMDAPETVDKGTKNKKLFMFIIAFFCITLQFSFNLNEENFKSSKDSNEVEYYTKLDSLENLLSNSSHDTIKSELYSRIAWEWRIEDVDSSIYFTLKALQLAKKNAWNRGMAFNLRNLGSYHYWKSEYPLSLHYYQKALKIERLIDNKMGIAATLSNLGSVYSNQGDYTRSLENYFKALKVAEEMGDKEAISVRLGNIGVVYSEQDNYEKALEYFFRALELSNELQNKNRIANNLGNIGSVYLRENKCYKAQEYYGKALKIDMELNDFRGIADDYSNLGISYLYLDDYPKALEYYFLALKADSNLKSDYGLAADLGNIGQVYTAMGKFELAESYLKQALQLSKVIGAKQFLRIQYEYFSTLYDTTNRPDEAFECYKMHVLYKDSILNEENLKKQTRTETRYEYEKAEILEEQEMRALKRVQYEKTKRRNLLQYAGIVLILLILFITTFLFAKKVNKTIKSKKVLNNERLISGLLFISFLLFFEFLLVLSDPYLDFIVGAEPAPRLLVNVLLAGIIYPLHSFLSKLVDDKALAYSDKLR